jgi:hypothetical protein
VLGLSLPAYTETRLASVDLTEIKPAEYRADVLVVLLDGDIPVRVIIVEVQLAVDPRKRRSWPAYVSVAHGVSHTVWPRRTAKATQHSSVAVACRI